MIVQFCVFGIAFKQVKTYPGDGQFRVKGNFIQAGGDYDGRLKYLITIFYLADDKTDLYEHWEYIRGKGAMSKIRIPKRFKNHKQ